MIIIVATHRQIPEIGFLCVSNGEAIVIAIGIVLVFGIISSHNTLRRRLDEFSHPAKYDGVSHRGTLGLRESPIKMAITKPQTRSAYTSTI